MHIDGIQTTKKIFLAISDRCGSKIKKEGVIVAANIENLSTQSLRKK